MTYAARVPARTDTTKPRSAYLWDAGLLTACKESRAIIKKHFRMDSWAHKRCDIESQGLSGRWIRYEDQHDSYLGYPLTTMVQEDQNWELLARPFDDLFCWRSTDWKGFVDMWGKSDTGFWLRSMPIKHIAIEFDKSWNVDVTRRPGVYNYQDSPRDFIYEVICDIARYGMHLQIWLIDRNSRWRTGSAALSRRDVFYDFEQEFIKVRGSDRQITDSFEDDTTALDFIYSIAELEGELTDLYEQCNGLGGPACDIDYFYVHHFINVLVPKDNIVQL
ncbi:hypothetical protein ACHAPJ_008864 [Fusarium lateritium]